MSALTERARILDMVEAGTISADEGATLLSVANQAAGGGLGGNSAETTPLPGDRDAPRRVRVRVFHADSKQSRINVNIPIDLVAVSMRMGARFVPWLSDETYGQLIADVQTAKTGAQFSFSDETSQEKIELLVE